MKVNEHQHLTYCTNIHPGESWEEVFEQLKNNIPEIKRKISPLKSFGIGLRLSGLASKEIMENNQLSIFIKWLKDNDLYVFTMNGFPYGGFHRQRVKDAVHKPDWSTAERLDYTCRLAAILSMLPGDDIERGISTSPISYKHWYESVFDKDYVMLTGSNQMIDLVKYLLIIKENTGKLIHIDIEPEPDGLIENSDEMIDFYNNWLLPAAKEHFDDAETVIRDHVRVCYDVCHFAVAYEDPATVIQKFQDHDIKIGKIQISAALKMDLPTQISEREKVKAVLQPFEESTYLHQVIQKNVDGSFEQFPDLPFALEMLNNPDAVQWRTHFHVPIYKESYGNIKSTQEDIVEVLRLNKMNPFTNHLEVETYTWEVLPVEERLEIKESIVRELEWVIGKI